MQILQPRLARERATVARMIQLYCQDMHGSGKNELCEDCQELKEYADHRLRRCPFQERKSTCARCLVHCYQPAMREKVRVVMRHSGPKMLRNSPVLALMHLLDGLRRPPRLPLKAGAPGKKPHKPQRG